MTPMTLLLIAQALMQYFAASSAASAQAQAVSEQQARQETDRQRRVAETRRQAAAEANEEARRRQADLALFDVVAGEYGGGASVSRARSVREVQASERMATLQGNESAALGQLGADGVSIQRQASSRLAAIDRPNPFVTALQIGTAYYSGQKPDAKPKPTYERDL